MIRGIHNEKDLDDYITGRKGWFLLAFHASWCRQCKAMHKTVENMSEEFQNELPFYMIDIDEMEELAKSLRIQGVPTYIVFENGNEMGRIIGYHQKDTFKQELNAILTKQDSDSKSSDK